MRVDKFVWCVRLAKTRSLAADLVKKDKVLLNKETTKVSKLVKVGDEISIIRGNAKFTFKVLALLNKRIGAPLVKDYLVETTAKEEQDKYKEYKAAQRGFRHHGDGMASKKDRRDLEDFLDKWSDLDESD